ncbi:MAG: MmgE/PrpD family protein [Candidatus Rokuibacteriota bacterium]
MIVPDYLGRLARFAAGLRLGALPASTVAAARLVLLDTLGAMAAGSPEPENAALAKLAARRAGSATLVGHGVKADGFWAALTNAVAGVALEVDEGNRLGGGHPAIHTLPGALAVAEEQGLGGRHLLEALVAGYEVGSRIGSATTVRANVHSHGTWGTISTAVAVARLCGAPAETMLEVINLAASMSPANTWTPALEGATIRNLYPGRSAWQGILAVELQRCGFTALDNGPADVYATILADRFEPDAAVAGLDDLGRGEPHRIEQNYFKLHACCRYNHFALDAVLALRRTHGLAPDDVARVEVVTIPFGIRMAAPDPGSPLAARFSIPHAIAAALVLGRADVTAFTAAAAGDARIRDLARRVDVRADPAMSPRRIDHPTAHVALTLRDGRTLHESTTIPRGDAASPVERGEIVAKFLSLASPVLGEPRAREVVATVERAETLTDVRGLTALL